MMKRIDFRRVAVLGALAAMFVLPSMSAQDAATTFKSKCAGCHGADGTGSAMGKKMGAHDFTSADVQKMSDADLTDIITNGKNMATGMSDQKAAVESGQWLLYRYHPQRSAAGLNPLVLDSRTPTRTVQDFMQMETRFTMLAKGNPQEAEEMWRRAQRDSDARYRLYEYLAQRRTAEAPVSK